MADKNYNAPPTDEEVQKWGRNYQAPQNNAAVAARGKKPKLNIKKLDLDYAKQRKPKKSSCKYDV